MIYKKLCKTRDLKNQNSKQFLLVVVFNMGVQFLVIFSNFVHNFSPYVHIHVTRLQVNFHILSHIKPIIDLLEISHCKNVASLVITRLL